MPPPASCRCVRQPHLYHLVGRHDGSEAAVSHEAAIVVKFPPAFREVPIFCESDSPFRGARVRYDSVGSAIRWRHNIMDADCTKSSVTIGGAHAVRPPLHQYTRICVDIGND